MLAATALAAGTAPVAGAERVEVSPSSHRSPPEPIARYLDAALRIIRTRALSADRVDWEALTPRLHAMAADATEPSGAYGAIRQALSALGDRHSRFVDPAAAAAHRQNERTDDFDFGARLVSGMGYVSVPTFGGGGAGRNTAFADALLDELQKLADAGARCWIVDLRGNGGGNMHPMIAGLAPLLGEGELGRFVAKNSQVAWLLNEGRPGTATWTGVVPTRRVAISGGVSAPVAVLIGPRTVSSGEATLVSFIGRPNTRTFGEPTAGLSTSNEAIPLSDGAMLVLTTAALADRTGKVYGDRIHPDVAVADPEGAASETSLTLREAVIWLQGHPDCSRR